MPTEYHMEPTKVYYTDGPHTPALTVRSGDRVITTTVDSRNWNKDREQIPGSMRQSDPNTQFHYGNPQNGPIYVEEAELGDTLAVRIRDIRINRKWGWSAQIQGFGGLVVESRFNGPTGLNEPIPQITYEYELDLGRMVGRIDLPNSRVKRLEIPLNPFLGCIGVAPRWGQTIFSMAPSDHGGNLDCPEVRVGTTVYLPVWVRGAYLMFGDVHAAQGEGETCGSAVEATADVEVEINVIKSKSIYWPRLEDAERIMAIGATRPLIDAFRIAHVELIDWLVADYGFDRWDALQMVTQLGTARIGNVVDPFYTVVAGYPKKYLP